MTIGASRPADAAPPCSQTPTPVTSAESSPCRASSCSSWPSRPSSSLVGFLDLHGGPLHADHRPDLRGEAGLPAAARRARARRRGGPASPRPTAWSCTARTSGPGPLERAGVVVFCHEFLGDRWSFQPYTDGLRDLGFDLFTFDFRNHGTSATEPGYEPLQWVSDREVRDLRAALAYLRSRPDRDPAGRRPVRDQPGGSDGAVRRGRGPDGLGRRHRRRLPDPRDDAGLHPALGRDLRRQPDDPPATCPLWVYAFVGWAGRIALAAAAAPPLPRRRAGRRPARPPPLADDPRREGRLHRPGDRPRPVRPAPASPRSSGSSPAPSTTAAARSSPRPTASGSPPSSAASAPAAWRPPHRLPPTASRPRPCRLPPLRSQPRIEPEPPGPPGLP